MPDNGSNPSLFDAITSVVDARLLSVHTAMPGTVEKYDYKTHKANVKPLLKKLYADGSSAELPVIVNVPVVWPRTTTFAMHAPLLKGDGVLLIFSERSLDAWLSKGGIVTPTDSRKFDLSDAIAIPGLFSFKDKTVVEDNNTFQLRYKDASIVIDNNGMVDINDGNLTIETGPSGT